MAEVFDPEPERAGPPHATPEGHRPTAEPDLRGRRRPRLAGARPRIVEGRAHRAFAARRLLSRLPPLPPAGPPPPRRPGPTRLVRRRRRADPPARGPRTHQARPPRRLSG